MRLVLQLALLALVLCNALPGAAQSATRTVYWIGPETASHDGIYTYDIDAGRVGTLVRTSALGPETRRKISALAVDVANGWLYWADSGYTGSDGVRYISPMLRVRLDGTGVETFLGAAGCGISGLTDIAFDPTGRTLYWSRISDCLGSNILYADASGPPPNETRSFQTRLPHSVVAFDIDVRGNALYWADDGAYSPAVPRGLYSAPVDRTTDDRRILPDLVCDVAVDPASASLYWTRCNDRVVVRSDLDGSNTRVVVGAGGAVSHLALDRAGRKVYWSEAGTGAGTGAIRRANLDGSGVEDVVTGLTRPQAVELGFGRFPVATEPVEPAPAQASLRPVSPNPARSGTTVTFDLAEPSHVRLAVFDATGREVTRLIDGARSAGTHTTAMSVRGLPSGLYVVRLVAGAEVASRPVAVTR